MDRQRYSNHRKTYAPHHFVFYPLLLIQIGLVIYAITSEENPRLVYYFILANSILIGWLSLMLRQHYALTLQNRLVRLEMRLRYQQVTGQRFDQWERKLSIGQVVALRFASDKELAELTNRAVTENLSGDAIKKAITEWVPDHMRV